jgi:nucleoside-diphosphate-sugar epimerase
VNAERERSVLLTGAAGFVGGHVARALAGAGWHVTGIDRAAVPAGAPLSEFRSCDLLDERALHELAESRAWKAVVHLAGALPTAGARGELFATNVGGTSAVLERLARPGRHVVLFSSGLVYGRQPAPFHEALPCAPLDAYGQSKLAAEALLQGWARATDSPATVLRPSVIYGAGAPSAMLIVSLLANLRAGEPFAMTAGEQLRDFVHVEDVADAVAAVLERCVTGVYNVASGESRSVRAAAELGAAIAGRPELLRIGALPYRDNEVFDYRLDGDRLRRALQWQPRVTLESGLRRIWEEMR